MSTRPVTTTAANDRPRFIRVVGVWIPFVVSLAVPIGPFWMLLIALGWAMAVVLRGRAGLPVAGLLSVLAVLANLILYAYVTSASVSFG
jgi:hypothetical protein